MDKDRLWKESKSCEVSGADLCKYYHRPLKSNYKTGDVIKPEEVSRFSICHSYVSSTEKFWTKSTQTDYRESEAQTDPWDPPFKISKVHKEPEVLSLRKFNYGNGLPAGLIEVNYISKTRELKNRKSEASPIDTDHMFAKKKQLMWDEVRNDWNYRTAVLNQKQLEKVALMQSTVVEELKRHSDKKENILKNRWENKKAEMSMRNLKLEQKLRKELHALESSLTSQERGNLKKDTSLKQKNKGEMTDGIDYMLSTYYLSNPEGLSTIKKWLETKTDALTNEIPLARFDKKNQREKFADKAYKCILEKKKSKLPPKVFHEDYVREETPVPPMKAEDVLEFLEAEEKTIDLVTVWQQVLRGLACQKQMLELIERHKDGLSTVLEPLYPGINNT